MSSAPSGIASPTRLESYECRTKPSNQYRIAATSAEHGIVSTHAHTTRRATPQRTADSRCREPTPTIAIIARLGMAEH